MMARRDRRGCAADRLAVFHHGLAGRDRLDRDLVAGIDALGSGDTRFERGSGLDGQGRHGNIVVRRQNDEGRRTHRHLPYYVCNRLRSSIAIFVFYPQ